MSKTNIVQKVLALCVVGAFAALGASCGSEADCSSGQEFYQGSCYDTCESVEDCEEGESCVGSAQLNGKVCVGSDDDSDAGMDGGVDDGGNDDDGGNGDDDGGNGDPDGGQICEPLNTCIQNSCGSQSGIDLAACVETNCETELNNCPEAAGLSCSGYVDCLNNCPEGDSACQNDCQSNLGTLGGIRVNAYGTCLDENNCDSPECRLQTCGDEYFACFPERSPQNKTCDDNMRCALGFSSVGNEVCDENMSVQARIDWNYLISCTQNEGCLTQDGLDITCMMRDCSSEATSCGLSGSRACYEVEACTRSVGSNEDFFECLFSFSSTQEVNEWDAVRTCINDNCSDAADQTLCAQSECGSERDACGLNGSNATCTDMWACLRGEKSDCDPSSDTFVEDFFVNYVFDGPAQAQSDFFALNSCRADNNCLADDQTCLETNCGSELDACGVTFGN